MINVSIFKNAKSTDPIDVDLVNVLSRIKEGYWKEKVDHLRSLSKDQYDEQKKNLPAVTFSGTFTKRSAADISKYSGLLILDIDHLEDSQIRSLKDQFISDEYVYCCFVSPSGKGLKILVKVNSPAESHLAAFLHVQKVFEEKYCFKVDDSGKDISRLCFVSYDEGMIMNVDSKVFEVDVRYGEAKKYVQPEGLKNVKALKDNSKIFSLCVSWVERTSSYSQGQRNRFIHSLACALNRCGVDKNDADYLIKGNYDLDPKEIEHCVKSAYFHYSSEHGSVEVKDIGIKEFKAPPYIANYTDDVVVNDIMQTTCMLHYHKIAPDDIYRIVGMMAKYYKDKGYIDFERKSLGKIMNEALSTLNEKVSEDLASSTLNYIEAEDLIKDIISIDFNSSAIPTTFPPIDMMIKGGMMPGSFYGVIGVGGTFKSVLSQYIACANAFSDKAVLYLNGEMTKFQFYERLASMTLNLRLYELIQNGKLTTETMPALIAEMNSVLKNNLFFVPGNGFNEENILATIESIKLKKGKNVSLVIIDGVTQMDNKGLNEIPAAIENTRICKEIAKNAHGGDGVVVLGLMHVSGLPNKLRRDNGDVCRGGVKTIANMDGYFSTSLLASEENNSIENQGNTDLIYTDSKFYLRFVDKRGGAGVINMILSVGNDLKLSVESTDVSKYEIKIQKK